MNVEFLYAGKKTTKKSNTEKAEPNIKAPYPVYGLFDL